MSLLFSNPELIRNVRIQLRPGRTIAAAVICLVVSATFWASIVHSLGPPEFPGWGRGAAVFVFILYLQIGILLIGGGLYCLQSVHREKELNTFDYQRVTRLSSLELTAGKLFGAPVLTYFLVLCLMPVALLGAMRGGVPFSLVAEAYILLLLGSIAYHMLALLTSVLLGRGTAVVAILLFLALVGVSSMDSASRPVPWNTSTWQVHQVSPFFAGELVTEHAPQSMPMPNSFAEGYSQTDSFLGRKIPHTIVVLVFYVTFAAWFLLAILRNIKRDPPVYEIYSSNQALCFVLYLNLIVVGFFPWAEAFRDKDFTIGTQAYHIPAGPPSAIELTLLGKSVWFFAILVLILLRNRERVRRRARTLGSRAAGLWAALWPAPYLTGAIALVGASIITLISYYRNPGAWDRWLALYYVAFVGLWLVRDSLYLQWMYLRRTKRPLGSAALYMTIFYACSEIVFGSLNLYHHARSAAISAIFVPSPLFALDSTFWNQGTRLWLGALAAQAMAALLFAWLHWQRLREFDTGVSPESTASRELTQPA
ncbi:MAG: hypothetical protein ABSE45_11540 [Candidatus Acidiferrales bacterium]